MGLYCKTATGRAKCRICEKRIAKGSIDLVFWGYGGEHYHKSCVAKLGVEDKSKVPRRLPTVKIKGQGNKLFFFDERLRELRAVDNPHDRISLNDFEVEYYRNKKEWRV